MKLFAGVLILSTMVGFAACEDKPAPNENTVAKFSVSNYDRNLPATVSFFNTSSKATTYLWSFGDGTTSTDANPTKVYANIGTYFIKLVATGPNGKDSTCKVLYYGDNSDPSKSYFVYLQDKCIGAPVSIAFTSLNPNSSEYSWEFENGGTSPLKAPIVQFPAPGSYMIKFSSRINGVRDTTELGLLIN